MAVQEQTPYIEHIANGVTTSFALEFDCKEKDHLIVLMDNVESNVGTWSLVNGAVVFGVTPANGTKITIQRNTPFRRDTNFQSFDNSMRPVTFNKDFDWIWFKLQELGVADWILGNRINALKNYVDDHDDALRAYLLDVIRKQGVALDQLDDYYNYLMKRLVKIATDKGWDASFVADESGRTQQALNYTTYRTITLEEFGGKTVEQNPLFDNANIIDRMLRSIYSLYDKSTELTAVEIRSAIDSTERIIIKLNGLYRTTRPFHIPPNVSIEQCFEGYFTQAPKVGIFYDPVELNSYAISPFLYKRNINGTYDVNTDVMFMPSGFDFDDGTCIMAGVRQQLKNLFVLTKRGVTLAYRLVGWAGNYAENIGCGENIGVLSRNPKVAMLIASAWGARINGLNTLSTHQGFIPYNANGGLVVTGMYSNQAANISDYVLDNSQIEPIYKTSKTTVKGSIGVMQLGEVRLISPICEGWYHPHYGEDVRVSIDEPHYERVAGYNFYLVNCEADVNLKGVTSIEAKALFYLKDYRDYGREVRVTGLLSMGGKLVEGENSDPSLILDVLRPHTFIQFWEFGDLSLIKSVQNDWGVNAIYVDPVDGDDNFTGLRDIRSVKTLKNANKLCELFSVKNIVLLNPLTVDSIVEMPSDLNILGSTLTFNAPMRFNSLGLVDISFNNASITGYLGTLLIFNTAFNNGSININTDLFAAESTLMQTSGDLNIDVNITNNTTNLSLISWCSVNRKVSVGWLVKATNYNVPFRFDGGGGYFKSISSDISVGSLAVAGQNIGANLTVVFDVPVKAAQVGDVMGATYSSYVAGLSYSAVVSISGNVKVGIRNNTGAVIALPSGTITTKIV